MTNSKLLIIFLILSTSTTLRAKSTHIDLNINYITGKSQVRNKDISLVKSFADYVKDLNNIKVIIAGHTDNVGSYETNVRLSKKRAKDLEKLLISYGLNSNYIETRWYSYDRPIATNSTIKGRRQNRRTNTKILGLSKKELKKIPDAITNSQSFSVKSDDEIDRSYKEPELTTSSSIQDFDPTKPIPQPLEAIQKTNKNSIEDKEEGRVQNVNEEPTDEPLTKAPLNDEVTKTKKANYEDRYFFGWSILDSEITARRPGFKATWITDFIHSPSAAYQFKLNKSFWLGSKATYRFQDYKNENNPIYTWNGNTPDTLLASIALDYEPGKAWGLGVDLSYREEIFVITDVLDISLEKAAFIESSLRGTYRFYQNHKYSSRFNGSLDIPLSSSDDLEPEGNLNFQLGLDFSFLKLIKNYELNLGLTFNRRNLENIQNEQDENYLNFNVRLRSKNWL